MSEQDMPSPIDPEEEFATVRRIYVEAAGEWYYVIIDVIEMLTDTSQPSRYWTEIKKRVNQQANRLGRAELFEFIEKFPFKNPSNNRTYQFECAHQAGILRIVQELRSENETVERLKVWMADTASRRLDEIQKDAIELERERYRQMGRSEEWISARLAAVSTRNILTDEWQDRGVQGREYGILTNTVHKGTFDVSVRQHKDKKGLDKGDLRDHMTPRELAFTILGEDMTTTELRKQDAQGFEENLDAARKGGRGAGQLRRQFEELTGEPVVSGESFLEEAHYDELEADIVEDDDIPF